MLIAWIIKKFNSKNAPSAQTGQDNESPQGGAPPAPAPAPASPGAPSSFRWRMILLISLLFPIFLETLDYTVVATAQPHIASVFHRLDLQSYIGTAYLLTSTVFLPLFASVADIYGRQWALQMSLAFFIVGSAISTGAVSMIMMIMGRGIAGIGAAGLLAVVRIILSDSNSLNDNTFQTTMLLFLYAVGYSVGPVIGGLLVSVSFRWVFAINLPCCVVAMVLCFILLRGRTKPGQPSNRLPLSAFDENGKLSFLRNLIRVDWVGTGLFISGGILVLLALNWGSTEGWNTAKVIVSLVVGSLLFLACIGWEYVLERQETSLSPSSLKIFWADPMVPLAVFRSYDICAVQFASFVSGMVMLVMFYFIAIFMTIVTGLSATKSGVQLIFFAPGVGLGSIIAVRLIKTLRQPKYPIVLGGVVICVSLGIIAMGMNINKQSLVNGFMAVAGVGTGLQLGPLAVQARFVMPTERVAVVAALTLFFRSFGGTVGLAQCAAILNGKVKSNLISLITSGDLSSAEVSALVSASSHGGLNSLQGIDSLSPHLQGLVRDAFRDGTKWCFISLIPWAVVSFALSLFLSKIKDTDQAEAPVGNSGPGSDVEKKAEGASSEKVVEEKREVENVGTNS